MSERKSHWFRLAKEHWPFLIPILILVPGLASFPFPGSGGGFSDFAVTHYPNAVFLKNALFSLHEIPLWSPNILSGSPFIAHPYSGIWYLPYWLALLFPLPFGLNLLTMVHLVWAGIGVQALLRQNGLGQRPALFGGLAFEATPALFAHLGAGHLMLLLAVCWTPWLLWAAGRWPAVSRISRLAQPGLVLALIFFADPRWAIYAGGLWVTWEFTRGRGEFFQVLQRVIKQIALVAGLTLPSIWLFAEYANLSTRAAITVSEVLTLSLPPAGLLGLLIPQFGAFHEWVLYPGVLVLVLALIASPWRRKTNYGRFWLAVLVVALILSLGSYIPGMQLLAGLPGFSQLRVPPRALLLAALAFSALAAQGFEALVGGEVSARTLRLLAVALFVFSLALAAIMAGLGSDLWISCLWAAVMTGLFAILFEFHLRNKLLSLALPLMALMLLDLVAMDASLVHFRPTSAVLAEGEDVAAFLAAQPGQFRVYSPSYSIPQQTAAIFGLALAEGVDPLQLTGYASFVEEATGVPAAGYSVSLPPLTGSGDPANANAAYVPDAVKLGLLNVEFVVSRFPIEATRLDEIKQISGDFIYRNEMVRPRAWIEAADGSVSPIEQIDWNYNHILIWAHGPGLLVLSEINYPGWQVRVDGKAADMQSYASLLRAVSMTAGEHEIVFSFEPFALRFFLPIPVFALIGLLVWPRTPRRK
jgi:hypothetical protein